MRNSIIALAGMALILAACGTAGGEEPTNPSTPTDGEAPVGWELGPFSVSGTQLQILESFPIQVRLHVTGDLPTPCHVPVWDVEDDGETIAVTFESAGDPDQVCAEVLETIEVTIDLGTFSEGSRTVTLNGEIVGEFTA